ncbi:hypothetical protein D3C72_1882320 [compost metagenome]
MLTAPRPRQTDLGCLRPLRRSTPAHAQSVRQRSPLAKLVQEFLLFLCREVLVAEFPILAKEPEQRVNIVRFNPTIAPGPIVREPKCCLTTIEHRPERLLIFRPFRPIACR